MRFARSGYDLDTHPAHMVRRVHQRATQHFQQVMDGDNISPTQFAALVTILKHGALSLLAKLGKEVVGDAAAA